MDLHRYFETERGNEYFNKRFPSSALRNQFYSLLPKRTVDIQFNSQQDLEDKFPNIPSHETEIVLLNTLQGNPNLLKDMELEDFDKIIDLIPPARQPFVTHLITAFYFLDNEALSEIYKPPSQAASHSISSSHSTLFAHSTKQTDTKGPKAYEKVFEPGLSSQERYFYLQDYLSKDENKGQAFYHSLINEFGREVFQAILKPTPAQPAPKQEVSSVESSKPASSLEIHPPGGPKVK